MGTEREGQNLETLPRSPGPGYPEEQVTVWEDQTFHRGADRWPQKENRPRDREGGVVKAVTKDSRVWGREVSLSFSRLTAQGTFQGQDLGWSIQSFSRQEALSTNNFDPKSRLLDTQGL